jgi:hypothetical protein
VVAVQGLALALALAMVVELGIAVPMEQLPMVVLPKAQHLEDQRDLQCQQEHVQLVPLVFH